MQIRFDSRLADGYKNASQRIRVLTEAWVGREIFCPACGEEIAKSVMSFKSNPPKDTNNLTKKRKQLAVLLTLLSEKKEV